MNTLLDKTTVKLHRVECCNCGVVFAITQDMYERRLEDGENFFCPNGHKQHYTRKEKLEDKIAELEDKLQLAKNRATYNQNQSQHRANQVRAYKGHLTRLKMKVADGRCPCCNTHFKDLHEHMQKEHPDYVETE